MSKRRCALFALAVAATVVALFACDDTDDAAPPTAVPTESGTAVLPPGSDAGPDSAAPLDASYVVPDGAVACSVSPCAVGITGAGSSFCALLGDGTVMCWGLNDQGQLGYDSGTTFPMVSTSPHRVTALAGITEVSAGDGNVCARDADGGVSCWGAPDLVGAGLTAVDGSAPPSDPVLTPRRETAVPAAAHVAVGTGIACIVSASGALECWGRNDDHELGRTADSPAPPGAVDLGNVSVASGRPGVSRTFAITSAGTLMSWGSNGESQLPTFMLGRDTSEDPDPSPQPVLDLSDVRAVATGSSHSCAIAGKTVACWGANDEGQLGRGSFGFDFHLPGVSNLAYVVAAEDADAGVVPSTDVPLDVAVGDSHTCAVLGSGRVYCWGKNEGGELGSGVTVARSGIPQRLVGLSGPAVHLASSATAVCALLRTGTVECWGTNYSGELGSGAYDQDPHPTPHAVVFQP